MDLSTPFERLAELLKTPEFRLSIAQADPENKTLMQAIQWARKVAKLAGTDIVDITPESRPNEPK